MLHNSDAPHVEIGLGKSISANTVFEGGDVYFDCGVQALPPSNRITWIHNVSVLIVLSGPTLKKKPNMYRSFH